MPLSLYPHQTEAIRKIRTGTILTGDVGTGKSITALGYFYIRVCEGMPRMKNVESVPMAKPRDLYIITTANKRDKHEWEADAIHFNLGKIPDLNGVKIHVDSWNNLDSYLDVEGAFFIFDEQRLGGSGAWSKAFLKIAPKNDWIVLSATPGDNWIDYVPIFIANGFYKNRTEFAHRHVEFDGYAKFPKIKKFHNTDHLEILRKRILVDMPYERHTIRHTDILSVEFNEAQFNEAYTDRWHRYEERPVKDITELYQLIRKIVNSDPSRMGAIMKLTEKHDKLIVFYNFNYELDILRTLASTLNIEVKEWNGQKHDKVPEGDRWLYLVQYTAGAEGWNCITTDAIAFYSLTYSWKAFQQAKGRIDRLNTPYKDLYYYVLRSTSKIDQAIWKALMTKKDFNARAWTKKRWEALELAA